MYFYTFYTLIVYTSTLVFLSTIRSTTSHSTPIFFTKLKNTDTHPSNFYNYDPNSQFGGEFQNYQTTSNYYYGTQPSEKSNNGQRSGKNGDKSGGKHNLNLPEKNESVSGTGVKGEKNEQVTGKPSKEDLSNEAYKLQESVKSMEESKDMIKELERKESELSEKLRDTNYEKINELVKKRNVLINKISALGKTLRREHDNAFPDLRDQPVVIIAKNKDDEKRKANQLAHLEGFEDFMHHITSPCNMMEELREKSSEPSKGVVRSKFETEQKILDSMSGKERLNYDRNMIEHYESIMREIEEGIRNAEDEISKSWNHLVE